MGGILKKRLNQTGEEPIQKGVPKEKAREEKRSDYYAAEKFMEKQEAEASLYPEEEISEEEAVHLKEMEEMLSEEKEQRREKRKRRIQIMLQVLLSISCIYLILLIYGVLTTDYQYGEDGQIEPIILSVSDITGWNEYSMVAGMYLQTRNLYEELLVLDYRVASGVEDTMAIAPEYESALDEISSLAVQIDASTTNSKYNQVKNMLLTWVQLHAAAYCQFMSGAISLNDAEAAAEAIACREVVYSDFQLITQNMIILGNEIKNYDVSNLASWSPDGYIQTMIEGITE